MVAVYTGHACFSEKGLATMTNILYERIVHPDTTSVDALIQLSELSRHSSYELYAEKLAKLIEDLKQPQAKLLKQPLFTWAELGVESPCFVFERHRALMGWYGQLEERAEAHAIDKDFEEAANTYFEATKVAMKCAENLAGWTALAMELRRTPTFDMHFLLAMVAAARSRAQKCLFLEAYKKRDEWKCGVLKPEMQSAKDAIAKACKFATLSSLLWARPQESKPGHVTTCLDDYEKELQSHYYEMGAYCASTFQQRLDNAAKCQQVFENMKEIMELNDKLYYLTPKECNAPQPATVQEICQIQM